MKPFLIVLKYKIRLYWSPFVIPLASTFLMCVLNTWPLKSQLCCLMFWTRVNSLRLIGRYACLSSFVFLIALRLAFLLEWPFKKYFIDFPGCEASLNTIAVISFSAVVPWLFNSLTHRASCISALKLPAKLKRRLWQVEEDSFSCQYLAWSYDLGNLWFLKTLVWLLRAMLDWKSGNQVPVPLLTLSRILAFSNLCSLWLYSLWNVGLWLSDLKSSF